MRGAERLAASALLAIAWAMPAAAAPADTADGEIRALIAVLAQSPCRFQRNGSWYDAPRAAAHLQRKYDYARRRQLAGDAETFIDQAATRSSFSGRPYRVACAGQPEVDAGDWFRARLASLRGRPAPR